MLDLLVVAADTDSAAAEAALAAAGDATDVRPDADLLGGRPTARGD